MEITLGRGGDRKLLLPIASNHNHVNVIINHNSIHGRVICFI